MIGGVLQYDHGKTIEEGKFILLGSLNKPPTVIRTGVTKLRARHWRRGGTIRKHLDTAFERNPSMSEEFEYPGPENDQLFQSDYDHETGKSDCDQCDPRRLLDRQPRKGHDPSIHYGLIGSANQVMRHGETREKLRQEQGILCFEMEAAGLMDEFPCIVIRGICDYSDSHKHKRWQPYSALVAAAYAKELLEIIPAVEVESTSTAVEVMKSG